MLKKGSVLVLCLLSATAFSQNYSPKLNYELQKIENSTDILKTLEAFGPKTLNSQNLKNTAAWLAQQYIAMGYDSVLIDSFSFNNQSLRNVVVFKPGISTKEYIIVCGHFDTRGGSGTNDNGSGVAAILQTAALLADKNTQRGIYFIHFDGEELGFWGSEFYVNSRLSKNYGNLYMLLNVDQIGGTKGEVGNDKIKCERDLSNLLSKQIADTIARLTTYYTNLEPILSEAYASDYVPFIDAKRTCVGLYQNATGTIFNHDASDTFGNLDTVSFKEAVKLTAATVVYFAQTPEIVGVESVSMTDFFEVFPNPNNGHFTIANHSNASILNQKLVDISGHEIQNNTENSLPSGIYFLQIECEEFMVVKRIVVY
ncbi:MAG: M28 family peptidase [Flavobacteriales bacterium]|nr:M28 family peptidase [Flavobacteriales bacterium]